MICLQETKSVSSELQVADYHLVACSSVIVTGLAKSYGVSRCDIIGQYSSDHNVIVLKY